MKHVLLVVSAVLCTALSFAQKVDSKPDSKILKNGFSVENFIGTATTDYSSGDFGVGVKLANYWYFGDSTTWKPGLKSTWFRGATYFGDDLTIQASVLNVGFANAFDFGNNIGLEANLNVGYNVVITIVDNYYDEYYSEDYYDDDFAGGGILFNPEIKFRYNVLAIGLDFVFTKVMEFDEKERYNGFYYENYSRDTAFSSVNLTIGAKF